MLTEKQIDTIAEKYTAGGLNGITDYRAFAYDIILAERQNAQLQERNRFIKIPSSAYRVGDGQFKVQPMMNLEQKLRFAIVEEVAGAYFGYGAEDCIIYMCESIKHLKSYLKKMGITLSKYHQEKLEEFSNKELLDVNGFFEFRNKPAGL